MYNTRKEVDAHVRAAFAKIHTEKEVTRCVYDFVNNNLGQDRQTAKEISLRFLLFWFVRGFLPSFLFSVFFFLRKSEVMWAVNLQLLIYWHFSFPSNLPCNRGQSIRLARWLKCCAVMQPPRILYPLWYPAIIPFPSLTYPCSSCTILAHLNGVASIVVAFTNCLFGTFCF